MSKQSLPANELIAPSLDLEPVPGLAGLVTGWRDRNTALTFEWEAVAVQAVDLSKMTFRISSLDLPTQFLVVAHLDRIGRELEPRKILKYRASISDIFERIDEFSGDSRVIADLIVDRIGGRDEFMEYCLKAIRACHLKFIRFDLSDLEGGGFITRKTADQVDFEIVK